MIITVKFGDFSNEKKYLALQNKFKGYDEKYINEDDYYKKVTKSDFEITLKSVDLITYQEDYNEVWFVKGFLSYKIQKLAKIYINNFKRYIKDNLFLDKDKTKLFAKIQLKKFIRINQSINNAEFLTKEIKINMQTQTFIVMEYLKNIHILPNYTIDEKFKMNLNKIDLLVLFTLLREKNIINAPYDNELGFLIEKSFLYKNGESYTPVKRAGKVVNDVRNSNKSIGKSIKRLKKILQNDDFYILQAD